jgi:hypothetical protein
MALIAERRDQRLHVWQPGSVEHFMEILRSPDMTHVEQWLRETEDDLVRLFCLLRLLEPMADVQPAHHVIQHSPAGYWDECASRLEQLRQVVCKVAANMRHTQSHSQLNMLFQALGFDRLGLVVVVDSRSEWALPPWANEKPFRSGLPSSPLREVPSARVDNHIQHLLYRGLKTAVKASWEKGWRYFKDTWKKLEKMASKADGQKIHSLQRNTTSGDAEQTREAKVQQQTEPQTRCSHDRLQHELLSDRLLEMFGFVEQVKSLCCSLRVTGFNEINLQYVAFFQKAPILETICMKPSFISDAVWRVKCSNTELGHSVSLSGTRPVSPMRTPGSMPFSDHFLLPFTHNIMSHITSNQPLAFQSLFRWATFIQVDFWTL